MMNLKKMLLSTIYYSLQTMNMHCNSETQNQFSSWELRCRFFVVFFAMMGISLMQHPATIAITGGFMLLLSIFAGVTFRQIVRRLLIVFPFLLLTLITLLFSEGVPISQHAANVAVLISVRIIGCVLAILLVSVEEIRNVLAAFRAMGFPEILCCTLFLTQRYIHLIGCRWTAVRNAIVSRLFSASLRLKTFEVYGHIVGGMTVSAIDRSEQIRKAMESRGFQGKIPTRNALPIRRNDIFKTAAVIAVLTATLFADYYGTLYNFILPTFSH
jgi:cobalt/nickel transport system permease protein